jgi:SAM-dependent methyltransferase
MWRAALKGGMLLGFGRAPGGARLYRRLTREWMGTQGTHVDKLRRVWPGYLEVWRTRCGLEFEGLDVWVHEGGWTPFAPLVNYLLTGRGGALTNREGWVLDHYLSRAVNGVLSTALPEALVPCERRRHLEALRWYDRAAGAVAAVGGEVHADVSPGAIRLASNSMDLCHSGGALEHYRPAELSAFLSECFRVLRPGGVASHVFDHRDHLYHADRRWPFLAHLALPGPLYKALCGHPLAYHNRLPPAQVTELFEAAGFERIAVRRMILPDRRYVEGDEICEGRPGLPRLLLAPGRHDLSDADRRTAACHYLYRKPITRPTSRGLLPW